MPAVPLKRLLAGGSDADLAGPRAAGLRRGAAPSLARERERARAGGGGIAAGGMTGATGSAVASTSRPAVNRPQSARESGSFVHASAGLPSVSCCVVPHGPADLPAGASMARLVARSTGRCLAAGPRWHGLAARSTGRCLAAGPRWHGLAARSTGRCLAAGPRWHGLAARSTGRCLAAGPAGGARWNGSRRDPRDAAPAAPTGRGLPAGPPGRGPIAPLPGEVHGTVPPRGSAEQVALAGGGVETRGGLS